MSEEMISCLICTRNRPDVIRAAVDSVLANNHEAFELTVVDQSTDGATGHALAPRRGDPRLRYMHVERAGLSAAYNTGIRASSSAIIACTDDDCVVPSDWLRSVAEAFARNPDVDLVYGQTLPAEEVSASEGIIPALSIERETKLGGGHPFYVYGMGANFATTRALFDRIGGFDEMLGGGAPLRSSQDFDYQYRAYLAGAVCLLTPAITVRHYGLRSYPDWPKTMQAYGIGDGAFYFKHMRCRDVTAARLMVTRLTPLLGRSIVSPLRRRGSYWIYLRSFVSGMRASLAFDVDRGRRLYIERTKAAT